jgi:hypothetical protein
VRVMGYANAKSLRHRLEDIFQSIEDLLKMKDRAKCVKQITKTRNFFAHMDANRNKDVLDGAQLFHYTELLNMIMQMLVLRSLGCDDHFIKRALRNRHYYFIREVLRDEFEEFLPESASGEAVKSE